MPSHRFNPSIPLLYALVALSIFALTRIGLALWTGLDAVPAADWPAMLAKGLWFDLAVLAVLLAPIWLYEALLPARWRAHRAHRAFRLAWFALSVFVLLFGAVAETTFWLEFATRFNFIAVDYLLYTHEVIGNIRESYPVAWIVGGLALAALAITLAIRPWLQRADEAPLSRRRRFAYVAAAIVLAGRGDDRRVGRPDGHDRQRLRGRARRQRPVHVRRGDAPQRARLRPVLRDDPAGGGRRHPARARCRAQAARPQRATARRRPTTKRPSRIAPASPAGRGTSSW